jgi:hypothetical protein
MNIFSGVSRLRLSSWLQTCFFSEEVQCGTELHKQVITTTRVTISRTSFRYFYLSFKALDHKPARKSHNMEQKLLNSIKHNCAIMWTATVV